MNASGRLNICKLRGSMIVVIQLMVIGKWVRNTYTTFQQVGDSPEKFGLIPRNIAMWYHIAIIDFLFVDGCAAD